MDSGFQFADIIILALIAGFIALRLRNTLGKDIGHRPDASHLQHPLSSDSTVKPTTQDQVIIFPGGKKVELKVEETPTDNAFDALDEGALKTTLADIKKEDPQFTLDEFLGGAKSAFEWVMEAYNKGDRATLKMLMNESVYKEFTAALDEADKQDEKHDLTLVSITDASLQDAEIVKGKARLTLYIQSDQVHLVRNAEGEVISGNASDISRVEDEWVFERSLKAKDPNWTIIDT